MHMSTFRAVCAGVILHPTSLPGPYGIGEIGKEAFKFIDWIASTGMQMWQVLPLVPPETQYWSPYAGRIIIISDSSMCISITVELSSSTLSWASRS